MKKLTPEWPNVNDGPNLDEGFNQILGWRRFSADIVDGRKFRFDRRCDGLAVNGDLWTLAVQFNRLRQILEKKPGSDNYINGHI